MPVCSRVRLGRDVGELELCISLKKSITEQHSQAGGRACEGRERMSRALQQGPDLLGESSNSDLGDSLAVNQGKVLLPQENSLPSAGKAL